MKNLIILLLSCLLMNSGQLAAKKLNLDLTKIGVSGLSSGGFMANQFHISHSDWVDKVGIIAAGPYYCAQNSIKTALAQCVNKSTDATNQSLTQQAEVYENQHKIANLDYLKNSKVWLIRGTKDTKIHENVTQALHEQYLMWIDPKNVEYVNQQPFAHHFPTLAFGSKCDVSEPPFVGNCDYDAAGNMLNFLHTDLQPRNTLPQGKLVSINQQSLGGEQATSLAEQGFMYIPKTCQAGESCQLHISFHGCQQNAETVGKQFVENNGLNNWADTNHLVVLYPQTKNSMFMPLNPQGCWDWWGYTDSEYATKNGQQIQAVKQIAESLTQALDI
ncbi:PHB depolymerase family esterase [Paraglaciecola sp. MB-3u-78]|uniref:extracellular catalytic domain type 2 short-chain-length polyhydroxyalkanoate depolymerase n=1 Tax=Paraglaciecola sp. MB-3u-78 TaxID=2058332 RepID=UPI000C31C650|nr:PHB depolymerase family esterase [Paraglaciecola sp. MB-3u-78]PKG96696.1 polyhydroxybutyrate depolymerase [Paraglaciecola sp. MB-3u-78]